MLKTIRVSIVSTKKMQQADIINQMHKFGEITQMQFFKCNVKISFQTAQAAADALVYFPIAYTQYKVAFEYQEDINLYHIEQFGQTNYLSSTLSSERSTFLIEYFF
jgi:hypothetical protein